MSLVIKPSGSGPADAVDWEAAFVKSLQKRITRAAWLALQDTGEDVKRSGRASIAAGGFSPKWQNAYRVKIYPPDRPSPDAALFAYHKVPYASIFELGGRVSAKPPGLMWLPTDNAPVLGGRQRKLTPDRFVRSFGPLKSRRRSEGNKTPLLFGRVPGTKRIVPMFIGIRVAQQRSRFNVGAAFVAAARRFDKYYYARLAETGEPE